MTEKEFRKARLKRQDQIRRDKQRLRSPITRMVGIEIFSNSNFKEGASFHAETTMAQTLGVNVKSIKRALPQLAAAGYIKVRKLGRCNWYDIVLSDDPTGGIMSPIEPPKGDKNDADRGHFRLGKGDISGLLTLEGNSVEGNPVGGDGDEEDARARELQKLCSKVLNAIGAGSDSRLSREAPRIVRNWLSKGWDPEVILAAVNYGKQSLHGSAPKTLRYFNQPIARLHAELSRPLPMTPEIGKTESLHQRAQRHAEAGVTYSERPTGLRITENEVARKEQHAGSPQSQHHDRSPVAPVRRPPVPLPPKEDPKSGTYQLEIAKVTGWDALMVLSQDRVADLCKRWKAGEVSPEELETIKLEHFRTAATGSPARKISSA